MNYLSRRANIARLSTICRENVKNFDEIPGPRGPFGLGNLYQYLPLIGKYKFDALHESGMDKYLRWGSIVRETMVPGTDVIWLFDPDDMATVLNDSNYPQRRSHLALLKYRKSRPHVYKTGGLLPTNGAEWWKLRTEVQKGLSTPTNVRAFLSSTDLITKDFVEGIISHNNTDFLPEISRLNLELVCLLAFDVRLNSFAAEEREPNSRTSRLIDAAEETNSAILPTDQGLQLWRFFNTPAYKRIKKSQSYLESVAVDLISQKMAYFEDSKLCKNGQTHAGKSLLDQYLKNEALDLQDIVGMACDLLLAGVHTTAYTTSFILYNLGMNLEVQEKLFAETLKVLPNWDDEISTKTLNSEVPYARAILKESLRLNPISVGVGRILNKETILHGYSVPKGTVVVTQNFTSCRLSKYFSNPEQFSPERWVNRENKKLINPYLVLPFGHGMRSCIARRLAEQNMLILMLRLIRRYKIKWTGKPTMGVVTKLINQPDQQIKVKFTKR